MRVYETEIKDGLEDAIKSSTIACISPAIEFNPSQDYINNIAKKIAKAYDNDQFDLFYLQSILVSTGWNKNDDVFDPAELWKARNTPEDKPFNFMHNEMDIIGHITANTVVDFEGNALEENLDQTPNSFNILTNAVIYRSWSDREQKERIEKLIAEIKENQWFVSMECLFPSFDYALLDKDQNTKIIQRNEASAFLTKHLRAYGGSGLYEDYKVGRLLRDLSFSGKGLVSKPANPRSVILDGNRFFDQSKSEILTIDLIREKSMSDNNESKIAELQSELKQAKAEHQKLLEKVVAEKESEYKSKIETLENSVAEKYEEVKNLLSEKEQLAEANKKLQEEAEAAKMEMKKKEQEMMDMKKKAMMMKRKAQLEDAGLTSEEAESVLESFASFEDDSFERVVALMKKKSMYKKEKEEKMMAEEIDSSEASEEILDTVVESAEVAIAEIDTQVDEAESLRSVASEWLGSILQSTPKNK